MPRRPLLKVYKVYNLSDEQIDSVFEKVNGVGGWQTFLRRLQLHVNREKKILTLTNREFDWMVRNIELVLDFNGGWQRRIPEECKMDALEHATS